MLAVPTQLSVGAIAFVRSALLRATVESIGAPVCVLVEAAESPQRDVGNLRSVGKTAMFHLMRQPAGSFMRVRGRGRPKTYFLATQKVFRYPRCHAITRHRSRDIGKSAKRVALTSSPASRVRSVEKRSNLHRRRKQQCERNGQSWKAIMSSR